MVSQNWEKYKIRERIGEGVFGVVDLAVGPQGNLVAVKRLLKTKPSFRVEHVRREVYVGRHLSHPNIVQLKEFFETEDEVLLVLEYVRGRDLLTFMEESGALPEDATRDLFKQICSALQYCHTHGVAHRDVKLDNVMVDDLKKITLIDFGLASYSNPRHCAEVVGSAEYCAPEIVGSSDGYDGCKADVWSCGIVLYCLLFGQFPFHKRDVKEMAKGNPVPIPWDDVPISDGAKSLISNLLNVDPDSRPSLDEILCHPWLQACDDMEMNDM